MIVTGVTKPEVGGLILTPVKGYLNYKESQVIGWTQDRLYEKLEIKYGWLNEDI